MLNILDELAREALMIRVIAFAESQSTGLSAATPSPTGMRQVLLHACLIQRRRDAFD